MMMSGFFLIKFLNHLRKIKSIYQRLHWVNNISQSITKRSQQNDVHSPPKIKRKSDTKWKRKLSYPLSHRTGGNQKRSWQSTNADQKSLDTVFRLPFVTNRATNGNRKPVLTNFGLRSSIVLTFSTAAYLVCVCLLLTCQFKPWYMFFSIL